MRFQAWRRRSLPRQWLTLSALVHLACSPTIAATTPPQAGRDAAQAAPTSAVDAHASSSASAALPAAFARPDEYVVAAGLRWLVTLSPSALVHALAAAAAPFPNPTRLAAFEHSVGLSASALTFAAIAGYDYATLYVVRADTDAALSDTKSRFRLRLNDTALATKALQLDVHSGVRDGVPQHFARLDGTTAAWAEGDLRPLQAAALLAQHRLTAPSARAGASLTLLPSDCHHGDLVAYVPGPLELTPESAGLAPSAVLSRLLAASVATRLGTDTLYIDGCVVGDWAQDGPARVQALLDALLSHRFISLLELSPEERRATLRQDGAAVRFSFAWRATPVLNRLGALLELDAPRLLESP